jgi:hypothetical protein
MEVVEKAGTAFAFPTRTLHVHGDRTDGHPLDGRGRPVSSSPPAARG